MGKVAPRSSRILLNREAFNDKTLGGAEVAVLTIKEVDTAIPTKLDRGGSSSWALVFAEKPDNFMWVDAGGEHALVAQLGNEDSAWLGKQVPLVLVTRTNPKDNSKVVKYVVADADDWKDIIREQAKLSKGKK